MGPIEGDIRTAVYPDRIAVELWCGGKWTAKLVYRREELNMLKKGDRAFIDCPTSKWHNVKVTLVTNCYTDSDGEELADIELDNGELHVGCFFRLLKPIETTITISVPAKHSWKDSPDQSTYANIRPGVNAAVMYAADGSSWEWAVGPSMHNVYGQGRSIDRRTAKSDAEFFIANYQPEDTSERDEIRRKLERSWHK